MRKFFSNAETVRLEVFGPLHIGLSIGIIILIALVIIFRKRLARSANKRSVKLDMGWVLLANMLIHYISKIIIGEWTFEVDLPLHLCFITNFFMIYILFTDNKHNLYSIVYYFTLVGPIPAMLWPDLAVSYDGYLFYQFIISHHIMLLFSTFCLFVFGYPSGFLSGIKAFFVGNALIMVMSVFNTIFNTNYIMISSLPDFIYELYPFARALPSLFWLELVGCLVLLLATIPPYLANPHNKETALPSPAEVKTKA